MKKAIAMILLGVMSLSLLTGNIHICTGGSAGK